MNSALVLIDIQNEYFEGGKNTLHHTEEAAAAAGRILKFFRDGGSPVIHIRHVSLSPGAAAFLPDSVGAEIHSSVAPAGGERVIVKHAPSAFLKTDLAEELRRLNIKELVVCGMMSHMCVDTSVRAAQDYGLSVTLIEDACTTKDLIWDDRVIPAETVHRTFMAALSGTFATVVRAGDYLEKH
jgi:nicotinamidase-related amidase